MSLISIASDKTDHADLTILAIVETLRDQEQPATASAVASLIGGAPVLKVLNRIHKLEDLGLLAMSSVYSCWELTELGSELMRKDMVGWSPSIREENRRTTELSVMREGLFRSRLR